MSDLSLIASAGLRADDTGPVDDDPYAALKRLWMFRYLFLANGHKYFLKDKAFLNDDVAWFLGVGDLVLDYDRPKAMQQLREGWRQSEAELPDIPAGTTLETNLRRLSEILSLSPLDLAILRFTVWLKQDIGMLELFRTHMSVSVMHMADTLARILGLPAAEVCGALGRESGLGHLLRTDHLATSMDLPRRLDLTDGLSHKMLTTWESDIELFSDTFVVGKPSRLDEADFSWMSMQSLLRAHLARSLAVRSVGVNILLHGDPGTGKTEFARWLAKACDGILYEIVAEDLRGVGRLWSLRLSHRILQARGKAVVLFDEIEDVFTDDKSIGRSAGRNKAEILRMLEDNVVPTLWVTNRVWRIDQAVLRRFDLVVEMKAPPKRKRETLLKEQVGTLHVSPAWLAQAAENDCLTPGIVERACRVVAGVAGEVPTDRHEVLLDAALSGTLKAQGHKPLPRIVASGTGAYRLDVLNTDTEIQRLVAGLSRNPHARLCLYGPSGTGKSALARHLAEQLGQPLLLKRASDLLSPWFGETEQNLARMFDEAREEGAILLLDEADSYLQDRRELGSTSKVAQVNELLTQMEAFEGLFVATTNLMDRLDTAVLRRFDLKLRFDYLRPDQSRQLFQDLAHDLNLAGEAGAVLARVMALNGLTPGDFAVVRRQARVMEGILDMESAVASLEREVAAKGQGVARAMGFVH